MPFKEADGLRYYYFDILDSKELIQAIFTRRGGVSPSPYATLNLGGSIGDSRENVIENRERIFRLIDRPVSSLFDVWQVHSREVICASEPRQLESPHKKADAIITNRSKITLLMRFADCVPIFLYDPVLRVVGIVHAGWQGTVKKIAAAAVEVMRREYGSIAGNILAGIGPSIGPDHYEIGIDVIHAVQRAFHANASMVLVHRDSRVYFDLWQANRMILEESGVEHIEVAGICTACHTEDWYSHRGESGRTGRFGAVIALQ